MAEIPDKAFYKVSEVCQYTDTQPYVLRFWESEFPQLAPQKGTSGQRVYSRKDLDLVLRIKKLLYEEEYTIAGARARLEQDVDVPSRQKPLDLLPDDAPPSAPEEGNGETETPSAAEAAAPPPKRGLPPQRPRAVPMPVETSPLPASAPVPSEELEAVQRRAAAHIEELQSTLQAAHADRSRLQRELEDIQSELRDTRERLRETQVALEAARDAQRESRSALEKAQADLAGQKRAADTARRDARATRDAAAKLASRLDDAAEILERHLPAEPAASA